MKHPLRLALLAGAVLLASGGLLALGREPAATPAKTAQAAALTVQLVQPQTELWPRTMTVNGALAPWQEASISAETGGLRIVALHADLGSRVRRGQLLAELASDTIKAELRQADANVAQARAALSEARANAERGDAVRDSGALSSQQIEQYHLAAQSAAARLEAAEAAQAAVKIKLSQTRIVAVDDGVVTARGAVLGAVAASGGELFRLMRQGRLEWRAEIDARQLGRLKPGQTTALTLPGGETVNGKVRALSPTLGDDTRHGVAYVDLPAESPARAGMYARGTIVLDNANALTVPASALTVRDGHSYVFEIDAARKVVQRKVATGRSLGSRTEISGVSNDAWLVAQGGAFLNDGDTVRVANGAEERS